MALWMGTAPREVLVRQWDAEPLSILYNPLSGDTHLLEPLVLEVLGLISVQPRTSQQLLGLLRDVFGGWNSSQALAMLEQTLSQLQDMGFAKRQSSVK